MTPKTRENKSSDNGIHWDDGHISYNSRRFLTRPSQNTYNYMLTELTNATFFPNCYSVPSSTLKILIFLDPSPKVFHVTNFLP